MKIINSKPVIQCSPLNIHPILFCNKYEKDPSFCYFVFVEDATIEGDRVVGIKEGAEVFRIETLGFNK